MTPRAGCALLLAGLGLAGCAAPRTVAPAGAPTASASAGPTAADPSYDWHALVRVPFGTPLRAAPLPLYEVLEFHASDREPAEARECYGVDGPAPRFLGATADEYLLCYEHDRLIRIEASVRLPPGEAAAIFARACASWLQRTAAAPAPLPAVTCEGRDHGITFNARLAAAADEPAGRVSMSVEASPYPPGTP